jgi:hypothetical protein
MAKRKHTLPLGCELFDENSVFEKENLFEIEFYIEDEDGAFDVYAFRLYMDSLDSKGREKYVSLGHESFALAENILSEKAKKDPDWLYDLMHGENSSCGHDLNMDI